MSHVTYFLWDGESNVCHLPQHLAHAKSLPSVKTEAHSKPSLQTSIKLSQNTVASETPLWQSSLRRRQCLCCTAGLKSSFKAASPFSQHRPSHNISYPKVLTVQVQLVNQTSFSQEGGGWVLYQRIGSEWDTHKTKNSYFQSLATQTEYSNWSSPGPRERFSTCHP